MQTCPFCHSVIVSSVCCAHVHSNPPQTPVFFAVRPNRYLAPPSVQEPTSFATPKACAGCGENKEENKVMQDKEISSLPTPHVSGHMFHFPCINKDLAQRLSGCQITCPINCLVHPLFPSSVLCHDSTFHSTTHHKQNIGEGSGHLTDLHSVFEDSSQVEISIIALKQSGWYWERLSWQEAEVLLQSTRVGTYLMRDSADPNHCFSLSVQTERGPTSVRIHFSRGKFCLKSEASIKASLPEFPCVVSLIEHYVSSNLKLNNHVWIDSSGKVYSPIRISQPLYKFVPSLKHLSRKAANEHFNRSVLTERLPPVLVTYIDEYPYWC